MDLLVDFGGRCCLGSQSKSDEGRGSEAADGSNVEKNSIRSLRDEPCHDDLAKELSEINIDDSFQIFSNNDDDEDDMSSVDDEKKHNNTLDGGAALKTPKRRQVENRRRSCVYMKNYKPSKDERDEIDRLGETLKVAFPSSSKVVSALRWLQFA